MCRFACNVVGSSVFPASEEAGKTNRNSKPSEPVLGLLTAIGTGEDGPMFLFYN